MRHEVRSGRGRSRPSPGHRASGRSHVIVSLITAVGAALVTTPRRLRDSRLRRAGSPPGAAARSQGLNGQTNVLQLANCVLGLSPMNSVADQMSPVGSANEAL